MSKQIQNTMLIDTARLPVVRLVGFGRLLIQASILPCPSSTDCNPDHSHLPAGTLTPDFSQLSEVPLIEEGTCGILALLPNVSDSLLALRF